MIEKELIISIIIPIFNRATLLAETLDSVLQQSYTQWECLVVDDGSTDATLEVAQSYVARDSRFHLYSRSKETVKGAPSCRNIGLIKATGRFVVFFDSDDLLLHDALSSRMAAVQASPNYDFWVFQTRRFYKSIGDDGYIWNDLSKPNTTDLQDFLKVNPVWHTSGVLWCKTFLDTTRLQYLEGVLSWQDWEFHIRVLLKQPKYIKYPSIKTQVFQRFHEGDAINSTVSDAYVLNRLELLITLVPAFKDAHLWHAETQQLFLKLFYFICHTHTFLPIYLSYWNRLASHFDQLPRRDVWFWKQYLFIGGQQGRRFYYRGFKCLQVLKKLYFSKRIQVTDFSERTWYKLETD